MGDLETVRRLVRAASAAIESQRRRIDDLNVYPVPDGDTGTNLALTVRAVRDALTHSRAADRLALAKEVVRAALLGARGNSGVILSQMVRGAAEALADTREIDARAVARALRGASDAAYRAVRNPVEGTMLTVVRELAEEAERLAERRPPLNEFLRALVQAGEGAVARTREQLQQLREAGVVNAGGAGVLELVRGLTAAVSGEPVAEAPPPDESDVGLEALHAEPSLYRYCTTFVVEGESLDAEAMERELEPLGDSLLVVGDPPAIKVHVHTDEPGRALAVGTSRGEIGHVEINNMHRQTAERNERLEERLVGSNGAPGALGATAAVVVYTGEGNRRLFADLGAGALVDGGPTMNPSAEDILEAIERAGAPEAVVLPNHPNVVMAAQQAAENATCAVHVVPTETIPSGLAAMVAFDRSLPAADNAESMAAAAAEIAAGAVAVASRDAQPDGVSVRTGEYFGLVGHTTVDAGAEFDAVAQAVVSRLLAEPRDVLTLLTGSDAARRGGARHRAGAEPSGARSRGARRRPAPLRAAHLGRVGRALEPLTQRSAMSPGRAERHDRGVGGKPR